ncbi:peptide chain release factor N(5)-glutamine methyltransferase [Alginatibacterium sediminis]|uniref:Release factor glutamine methyltransferase n=1 Tax=Alginatibacterium sediminis TaxID=2164068 RepID=A0A420E6F1_9ALTE|nr:peptide chain release factor N(5)-glutamine methyltransferase [Alginatibacterium sediminis]
MNIEQALAFGENQLADLASELISPRVDVRHLLCSCLEVERSYLMTWPEKLLSPQQTTRFESMLKRRLNGEPVAYIVGHQGFWDLDLLVSSHTLIPRADTEILVELALELGSQAQQILDLGTGTGAIALALAKELPNAKVLGLDFFVEVITLANANANRNQISNVEFHQSDWFSILSSKDHDRFDLIVSNPPYIDADDPHLSQGDVRFEPTSALSAADQGYADLQLIIERSRLFLKPGAWLLLEHGFQQSEQVAERMQFAGFKNVSNHLDFGGNPRVTVGQFID